MQIGADGHFVLWNHKQFCFSKTLTTHMPDHYIKPTIEAWNTRTPPEGMVMVPVEPTVRMINVGRDNMDLYGYEKTRSVYKAMLQAAEGER